MEKKKSFRNGFLCGVLAMLLLCGVVFVAKSVRGLYQAIQASVRLEDSGSAEEEGLLSDKVRQKADVIQEIIEEYYLDEVSTKQLQEGVYRGIVDALEDPYSTYYTAEEMIEQQNSMQGIYYGIGAYISRQEEGISVITGTIPDSPAEEVGLMDGDIIRKVDGESVDGWEQTEIVARIKGEEGSYVTLTLERDGKLLDVEVQRREVKNQTVSSQMKEDGIAYIHISEFDTVTLEQFEAAMADMENQGMEAMILDLRGNPGGNLSTVCDIARLLLPKGLIVYTEDKYGEKEQHTCDGKHAFTKPLAVLVDGSSASASEILAGAIKDYQVGTLIGTTTYGKGVVQRPITISDGSAVKVTVSKYYTPAGNNIHEIGIEPDIEVPWDYEKYIEDGTDNQLDYAVEYLKGQESSEPDAVE